MPVHVIKLDSAGVRERVRNGKYFQITNVPTLLVTYTDGNLQLFQGQAKIMEWLNKVLVQRNQPQAPPVPQDAQPQARTAKAQPRRERIKEPEEEPEDGVEPEEEEEQRPPPKKAKAAKSKKKPPVKFKSSKKRDEDDEENLELILGDEEDSPSSQPSPSIASKRSMTKSNPLSTGKSKSGGMANLVEQARKMEQERKASLGYDEKDLPKYG